MRKHFFSGLIFFIAVTLFSSDLILEQTQNIVSGIKTTVYAHKSSINETKGHYVTDCSGLLTYVIMMTVPQALKQVEISAGHKTRRAVNFYDTVVRAGKEKVPNWQKISGFKNARPGDIIVWVNPPESDDSGHVMIIMESPVPEGKDLFRVKICDSSKTSHGSDSRTFGSNGVGTGLIWFETDENTLPLAFRWSSPSSKSVSRSIVIGRILSD